MNGTVLTGVTIQSFNYVSTVFMLPEWGVTLAIGPYYANSQMSGNINAQNKGVSLISFFMGLGYLWDKWSINTSYITSYSNVGGLNMDIGYQVGAFTPFIGWGLSTPAPVQNIDSGTGLSAMEKSPIFYYYSMGLNINF